jgi:thiamine phosphate synthase YjbQ (UPF0047 family)
MGDDLLLTTTGTEIETETADIVIGIEIVILIKEEEIATETGTGPEEGTGTAIEIKEVEVGVLKDIRKEIDHQIENLIKEIGAKKGLVLLLIEETETETHLRHRLSMRKSLQLSNHFHLKQ